ncbi:hypothetical protein GCM10027612_14590 [Microbispora bryophytorum subsp. camponoti]
MIWLTWRQFRGSAAMMAALLVVLTVVLTLTGPDLASRYAAGIAACTPDDTCDRFFDGFFGEYQLLFVAVSFVVLALPALVGLFWGRRCSPASWRQARTCWYGTRASPAVAGWR